MKVVQRIHFGKHCHTGMHAPAVSALCIGFLGNDDIDNSLVYRIFAQLMLTIVSVTVYLDCTVIADCLFY